jgi:hypothetical protein
MSTYGEKDKSEIISCVVKFYQLISGNCSDKRDWPEFSRLFAQNAKLTAIKNGNGDNIISLNVHDYISRLSQYLENNDFWERGSDFQVTICDHIASISSTYEASTERDFRATMKCGVNFVHLVKINNRWKIFSMLWEDDPERKSFLDQGV